MTKLQTFNKVLEKLANSPDQEFEQSFFQLAYERLQDKLHNLLPFLVGFEIVNKNDDGTKALGVFGFKSNNGQMLFVPAFFINGTVKGIDLIYSKNNEQFYPLNEDFAELFLKDEVTGIGDTSHETKQQINQHLAPIKLDSMKRPPQTGKTASIKYTTLLEFIENGEPIVKKAFYKVFSENEKFCESVLRFYDLEKIAKALVIHKEPQKFIDPEIKIFKLGNDLSELNGDQRLEVLNKGYLMLDKRAEDKKSKIGLFKYTETFSNPTESGFYSYLTQRGNLRYGLVLLQPHTLRGYFSGGDSLVIDLDSSKEGQTHMVEPNKLFTKGKYHVKDFSTIHEMMQEPAEVSPSFDTTYILVNDALVCTEPFRVISNYKTDEGIRTIEVERRPSCGTYRPNSYFNDKPKHSHKPIKLVMTKKTGAKLEHRGRMVLVPKGFKLLPVKFSTFSAVYEDNRPGTLDDLNAALRADSIFDFSVNSNGSEYFMTVGAKKKKYDNPLKAKIGMVLDFGISEKVAGELVDSINYTSEVTGQIKLAYTGDQVFSLRDPSEYANMLGQPTQQENNGYSEEMPRDQTYQDDPTSIGRATMPDVQGISGAIDQANQLADNGQKQIFDTQAIATLSKYVSPQTKTMTYMPEFISCLDKLGRMLFLTYWETEKFEEMYGRSEMPDLVELLTNVFKNLGDLVIYLKRKAPELSINMSESDSINQ